VAGNACHQRRKTNRGLLLPQFSPRTPALSFLKGTPKGALYLDCPDWRTPENRSPRTAEQSPRVSASPRLRPAARAPKGQRMTTPGPEKQYPGAKNRPFTAESVQQASDPPEGSASRTPNKKSAKRSYRIGVTGRPLLVADFLYPDPPPEGSNPPTVGISAWPPPGKGGLDNAKIPSFRTRHRVRPPTQSPEPGREGRDSFCGHSRRRMSTHVTLRPYARMGCAAAPTSNFFC